MKNYLFAFFLSNLVFLSSTYSQSICIGTGLPVYHPKDSRFNTVFNFDVPFYFGSYRPFFHFGYATQKPEQLVFLSFNINRALWRKDKHTFSVELGLISNSYLNSKTGDQGARIGARYSRTLSKHLYLHINPYSIVKFSPVQFEGRSVNRFNPPSDFYSGRFTFGLSIQIEYIFGKRHYSYYQTTFD
jgi:hypothetical protein